MRSILSTRFTHLDDDLLLSEMKERIASRTRTSCCYANFSQVLLNEQNQRFRLNFERADIVVPDGVALAIAGWLLERNPIKLKTVNNTTDLFNRMLHFATMEHFRVYFIGGTKSDAAVLGERLSRKFPGLQIAGIHHGHVDDYSEAIVDSINASNADIVMVGMGSPRQEAWLGLHRDELQAPFVMTVGAYISFLSDGLSRAPFMFRQLRLEWFYRLCQEPGRLWKRYLVGGSSFLLLVLREWMRKE